MSEVTNMSQALQSCQNKLDLVLECLKDLVKDAVQENEGEKKKELLTFIENSTEKLQEFTEMLDEEPKINPLKKRSFKTSTHVPEKKLKFSPSPLMDLPNEIWMKIMSFLSTCDILKNFNLTCKHFHSLAINPSAIKSLQLKLYDTEDTSQCHKIVKVLQRSKTLNKLIFEGQGEVMNHILAHGLKSNHLKTLQVKCDIKAPLSKKNLEYIQNSNIKSLKFDEVILDNYAMQQIGAVKTLKSVNISMLGYSETYPPFISISELIKTFTDSKIELEDLAIVACKDLFEIYPSVFEKFLEERGGTLKKLKIRCTMNDTTMKDERKGKKFSMKWNATPNLEELYYDDFGSQNGTCPIEFGLEMAKLTKLVLQNINGNILQIFGTQNFPVLKRLYLHKGFGNENVSQHTIFNILKNCTNLKSVKLEGFDFSDVQLSEDWYPILYKIYKSFNVYIEIVSSHNWSLNLTTMDIEEYLKKTDLATFDKYTKIKKDYIDWEKEQFRSDEWLWWI